MYTRNPHHRGRARGDRAHVVRAGPTDPVALSGSYANLQSPTVRLELQRTARNLVAERNMRPLAAGRMFAAVSVAAMGAADGRAGLRLVRLLALHPIDPQGELGNLAMRPVHPS